jgi:hypothetical protein
MSGMGEGVLIVVGLGTAAFMLAMSRIVTAEAARVLDVHFLQVKAMKLRNEYARTLLSLRPDGRAGGRREEPIEVWPVDEVAPGPDARADRRAA